MLQMFTSLEFLRETTAAWRAAGARIALVPTMGALHAGHLALVKHAQQLADRVIVSIFVNPTQFGPNEDFASYPRTEKDDIAALTQLGVDALWLPNREAMYPPGFATNIRVSGITERYEGAIRPGHFDGVATVVAKLFAQTQPHTAIFGEKDYQQLCLIKRLVSDLDMDISIIGMPTLREADGLALSSRNRFLSDAQRAIAPLLHQQLQWSQQQIGQGHAITPALNTARNALLQNGFHGVDYVAYVDAETLAPRETYAANGRLLAAARLGSTRLIDNIAVE